MSFAGLFAAASYYRRHPDAHKRLMILAMVGGMVPAAVGRLPDAIGFTVLLALLLAGPTSVIFSAQN